MSTTDTSKTAPNPAAANAPAANFAVAAKTGARRKRFLAASVAALAVLAVAMGVSFLGNTGTAGVEVKASNSEFVFPVSKSGFGAHKTLEEESKTVATLKWGSTTTAGTLPSWSPTLNTAGEVASDGDMALVDATGTPLIVNVFVTNLVGLQGDYSSFAFPMHVYQNKTGTCTGGTGAKACEWEEDKSLSETYLTNTEGNLSFSLPSGHFYDITLNKGGSFYTISTTAGELSPSFYFTAQAT